ncbi:alpha/beta fold hydrolase [uncultured Sulfitobacter sp.]|uniref:alpha/beta fold hydrolase n=1 Tax=uncultured Sulfitobacter sp. TaxID=191468 RepID=UPI002628E05D|nr:alpha/beta fold hydrolase [uncultured Sulfitobacter sp.]
MARDSARAQVQLDVTPDTAWAALRDFCAPWHPWIATMQAEEGGGVRAFTVKAEETLYRERLTWFSDTDKVMCYTHLQGIDGAQRYDGMLSVAAAEKGGSIVTMSAEIEALAERAADIACGTTAVFEAGLAALETGLSQAGAGGAPLKPLPLEHRTIDDLPRLGLTMTPAKDGPLLLFLHGIGGNRSNWTRQLGRAGHVVQAAALDLRGYGDSTLGAGQSTVEAYCADIRRVMEVLGKSQVILCGLSYGAWIATAFAESHPDLTAGLVVSGGCTGMSEAGPEERDAFRVSREVPLDAGQATADFAPGVIGAISGPEVDANIRAELTASMAAIPTETYRDALRCFTNPLRRFDFARLTMPVLLMTGEHDKLAPPTEIKSVAHRIHAASPNPDVRFEIIAGAGHICNVEKPYLYTAPLMEFLRRVAG